MTIDFLLNNEKNIQYNKYIKTYTIVNKLQYYPCCYIIWIKKDNINVNYLKDKKLTVLNVNQTIFCGEIIDLWETPQYITTFYKPQFNSIDGLYNFLESQLIYEYKYQTHFLVTIQFEGELINKTKVFFDYSNYDDLTILNIMEKHIVHCEINENIPHNINILIQNNYKTILPLNIRSTDYDNTYYTNEEINIFNREIPKNIHKFHGDQIYLKEFSYDRVGENQYVLHGDYLNEINLKIEEELLINLKHSDTAYTKNILFFQKSYNVNFYNSFLSPFFSYVEQQSQIKALEIKEFIKSYLNYIQLKYKFNLVINCENYSLNCGDNIEFIFDNIEYIGKIFKLIIKPLEGFFLKNFYIIEGYCYIKDKLNTNIQEGKEKVNGIIFPDICNIPVASIQKKWQEEFFLQITKHDIKIKIPRITDLNKTIKHENINFNI